MSLHSQTTCSDWDSGERSVFKCRKPSTTPLRRKHVLHMFPERTFSAFLSKRKKHLEDKVSILQCNGFKFPHVTRNLFPQKKTAESSSNIVYILITETTDSDMWNVVCNWKFYVADSKSERWILSDFKWMTLNLFATKRIYLNAWWFYCGWLNQFSNGILFRKGFSRNNHLAVTSFFLLYSD